MRRLALAFLTFAALHPSIAAADETWPNKQTIRLIVPYAAGGNGDQVGRVTAQYMGKVLKGTQVVVENRPGAGGITGTQAVTKATPDGYTLCVCSLGPITVVPAVDKLPYDPLTELLPISRINTNPLVLLVNPKSEPKTVAEFVAWTKSKPGGINYGSSGIGGLMFYAMEVFRKKTGAVMTHVPYRGGPPATTALVAGEISAVFANMSDVIGQLEGKTVRPIAISTARRSPFLPDVPTMEEEGIKDFDMVGWNALFAPPGVPKPIVDRLAAIMADMAKDPEVVKAMALFGSTTISMTPEEFARDLREETARWAAYLSGMQMK
jgi:tripartite-type tricarboxylate transporter receptor subunit TctC